MGKKITDSQDPFEKYQVYLLSDKTREELSKPHPTGFMHLGTHITIEVTHITPDQIKSNPELRDKIIRMAAVGAVAFGAMDETGKVNSMKFHKDVIDAMQGRRVTGPDLVLSISDVDFEAMSAQEIENLAHAVLKSIVENASDQETVETPEADEEKKKSIQEGVIGNPQFSGSKTAHPRSTSKKSKQETRSAEAMINQHIHTAEQHRRAKEKEKKERKKHREKRIIDHEIKKAEIKAEGLKQEKIQKEKKGRA